MTTAEEFDLALDAIPTDWDLRRVYADHLESQGRDFPAYVQRWMAAHNVAPSRVPWESVGGPWWGYEGSGRWEHVGPGPFAPVDATSRHETRPSYTLPSVLWHAMEGDRWATRRDAEAALTDALHALHGMLALPHFADDPAAIRVKDPAGRRLATLKVTGDLMCAVLHLPADARIVDMSRGAFWHADFFALVVECPAFAPVPEGAFPPVVSPLYAEERKARFEGWGFAGGDEPRGDDD